jgi:hypothetical protein
MTQEEQHLWRQQLLSDFPNADPLAVDYVLACYDKCPELLGRSSAKDLPSIENNGVPTSWSVIPPLALDG